MQKEKPHTSVNAVLIVGLDLVIELHDGECSKKEI